MPNFLVLGSVDMAGGDPKGKSREKEIREYKGRREDQRERESDWSGRGRLSGYRKAQETEAGVLN